MAYPKEKVAAVLKQMRINRGLTQKEVAESIGRNQPIIGHWESGYSQPDVNTLFRLCELYGVSDVSAAFGFEKQNKPTTANSSELNSNEIAVALAYRQASEDDKAVVDAVLKKYASPQSSFTKKAI